MGIESREKQINELEWVKKKRNAIKTLFADKEFPVIPTSTLEGALFMSAQKMPVRQASKDNSQSDRHQPNAPTRIFLPVERDNARIGSSDGFGGPTPTSIFAFLMMAKFRLGLGF